MNRVKAGVLAFVVVAGVTAQSPEPPLSDTRLTVHTLLREDVFSGFLANDLSRFARAERNAVALLEQRPGERGNIRAWQGGMSLYRAVRAHEVGQAAEFQRLYQQTRDFFMEAGKTTSGNDGVPAVVGGSLAVFADRLPQEHRAAAWTLAYDAYVTLWRGQAPAIDKLPVHFRGEVLAGWAQAAQRTGHTEEAAQAVDKTLALMKGTPYEGTAQEWKTNPASAAATTLTCKGCHEAGRLSSRLAELNK
jgi:hypothetical protein